MSGKTKGKINIPRNVDDLLKLAGKVYEKHQGDGEDSPLNHMEDNKWEDSGPKIKTAVDFSNDAKRYKGLMETAIRERDKLIPEIQGIVSNSASLLKSVHSKNVKHLTEWGYTVTDTPPSQKKSAN